MTTSDLTADRLIDLTGFPEPTGPTGPTELGEPAHRTGRGGPTTDRPAPGDVPAASAAERLALVLLADLAAGRRPSRPVAARPIAPTGRSGAPVDDGTLVPSVVDLGACPVPDDVAEVPSRRRTAPVHPSPDHALPVHALPVRSVCATVPVRVTSSRHPGARPVPQPVRQPVPQPVRRVARPGLRLTALGQVVAVLAVTLVVVVLALVSGGSGGDAAAAGRVTTPVAGAPAAPAGASVTVLARSGDSVQAIAARTLPDVPAAEAVPLILAANGLTADEGSHLGAGQAVVVPLA